MQPEINYTMVGQRIRTARLQKKLSQAELGSLVGCSNNHISHIETAQTKVFSFHALQTGACSESGS